MAVMEFKESCVPRLGQKNYIVWAAKIECLLKAKELWYIVENPPHVFAVADQKRHDQAMAYLILNLDDEQFLNVANLKTSKEIWLKLRAVHVNVSACNIVQLSRKLYRACLQPGESVEQHLNKMQSLFLDLEQRGIKFPESQKVLLVLNNLDKTWDTVSAIFECKEEQDLNFEALKACLLNEEKKRHFRSSHEEKFLRRGSRLQVSEEETFCKQRAKQEKNCYICGKTHLKRNCLQMNYLQQRTFVQPKRTGLQKEHFDVAKVCYSNNRDKWLIDRGASQTIVNDSELFCKFVPVAQEAVALANGQKAKVIGRGNVKIPYLESKFTNVLCVPEMEHNLLSVSNLDKQGFEVIFVNGKCLIKRNGNICAEGIQEDNLYALQGQKVQRSHIFKNVAEHDSCVHLLHRRLGHASFKVLQQMQDFAEGLNLKGCKTYLDCAVCKASKNGSQFVF